MPPIPRFPDRLLGYAYDSTRSVKAYGGCALIYGGSVNYTAINNYDMDIGVYDDFTKAHKWKVLSGAADIFRAGPSDVSMVISGGPVTIPGGEDTVLTFALTAGDNLQGLENAVRVAKEMYNGQNGIVNPPAIPTLAQLYQNYPNPFPGPANPNTIISFELSQPAHVTIELCNVIGQKVATLTDESYFAGEHRLSLPSGGLASGVYFVRMKATSMSQVYIESKKIIVLK